MTPEWDKALLIVFGAANLVTVADRYFDFRRKRASAKAGDEREVKVQHVADEKLQAFKEKAVDDRFLRLENDFHELRGETRGETRRLHEAASDYADQQQIKITEMSTAIVELRAQAKTLFRMIGQRKGEG